MGAGNYKSEKSSKQLPMELPDLLYFNRKKGVIIKSSGRNLIKIKPNIKFFYAEDSAIGHLVGQRLIIIGGSYNSRPRSLVTMIYIGNCKIESLRDIPEPSTNGWIHEISNWVYYIGGQTIKNNKTVQTSLYRYHQTLKYWEEFTANEEFNNLYKSLCNYGSCLFNKKILIFGGQVQVLDTLSSNTKVFFIDTEQYSINHETIFNFEVIHPIIASGGKHALLVGGKNPADEMPNKHTLYFSLKENGLNIEKLDKINSEVIERYPPVYQQKYAFFVYFPNILVRFRNKTVWNEISLKSSGNKKKKKKKREEDKEVDRIIDENIWKHEFFPGESHGPIDSVGAGDEEKTMKDSGEMNENEEIDDEYKNKSLIYPKSSQFYRLRRSSSNRLPLMIPTVPEIYTSTPSPLMELEKDSVLKSDSDDELIKKSDSRPFIVEPNKKSVEFSLVDQENRLILQDSHAVDKKNCLISAPSEFFDGLMGILRLDNEVFHGNFKEFYVFLCEKLENREYSIVNDFFRFLSIAHLLLDCEPLSDKKKWLCAIQLDLMPDKDKISKKKFAKAIYQTLKLKNKLKNKIEL